MSRSQFYCRQEMILSPQRCICNFLCWHKLQKLQPVACCTNNILNEESAKEVYMELFHVEELKVFIYSGHIIYSRICVTCRCKLRKK